jgi:hypothetical protein
MSKGVLIFAQNNADIDYIKIAIFAAERVKKFLNVPVSLVTDNKEYLFNKYPEQASIFDKVIDVYTSFAQNKMFFDGALSSKVLQWKNFSRSDCFDITPYDETIVIDADYIINSDQLSKVWSSPNDLMMFRTSFDLAGWRDTTYYDYLNSYSVPFYWATVFYFQKTSVTNSFFKLVQYIRLNWQYYRMLYSIDSPAFRNDFAFSIAVHIMNDSVDSEFISYLPGKLFYTLDRDILLAAKDTSMTFLVEKENHTGEYTAMNTNNLDVHVMNKYSLSRFVDEL